MPRAYYIVLHKDGRMLYPIKSDVSPYRGDFREPFGAGQPHMFGGQPGAREEAFETLERETWEESATTVLLHNFGSVFDQDGYEKRNEYVHCVLYASQQYARPKPWPSWREWLALHRRRPAFGEMCWLATIERTQFRHYDSVATIAEKMLANARRQAPDWARERMKEHPTGEYLNSVYARGFHTFVQRWLRP